jgi:sugar transferase (PEP-CTERM/EpsH1 system associated)
MAWWISSNASGSGAHCLNPPEVMMKILYVVPYVPSLIRVRPYNFIRALSQRGHHVTVLTLWTNEQEREEARHLSQICQEVRGLPLPRWRSWWNSLQALPGSTPLQAMYCWEPRLPALAPLEQLPVDVIHVEHIRGARYGLAYKSHSAQRPHPLPVIWDSVDCISYLFQQAQQQSRSLFGKLMTRLELARTQRYEGWLLSQFDRVLVTSAKDKTELDKLGRAIEPGATAGDNLHILPNGVDLDYFTPTAEAREPQTLVFSGKMSYHANITTALHLIETIMPLVWDKRPAIKLLVVGKDPPRQVLAAAARHAQRVLVTGSVPDVRPYLRRAALAVIPLVYGAGVQNKVLEAMACATPVVVSPTALAALGAVPGRDVLVADSPTAFAATTLALLDNPSQQQHLGTAGRRFVEDHHHWDKLAGRLEDVYREAIQTRAVARPVP